jgi:hypothetical protein
MKPNYFNEPEHIYFYKQLYGIVTIPDYLDHCYLLTHGHRKRNIEDRPYSKTDEIICKELTDAIDILNRTYNYTNNEINIENLYDPFTRDLYNYSIRTYIFYKH